ncbi:MAG: hypothetical protein WD066_07190 [Planctomycetaceae bacterium]
MPFRFEKASCVAAGTFNMYIVQPAWLGRREIAIFPEGTELEIETRLDAPGFKFQSPQLPAVWTVTPSRITLETADPEHECGETLARVLKALPWTPLVAVGTNGVYEGVKSDLDGMGGIAAYPFADRKPADFELAQRGYHVALKRGDLVLNLQLSVKADSVGLSFNAHTDLRNKNNESALDAARGFLDHRRLAESLLSDIFQVDIEHASRDS